MCRKIIFMVTGCILISIALSGCISTTTPPVTHSPIASVPEVIIDYVNNVTKIWVKSAAYDYKYTEINITVYDENNRSYSIRDTYTYCAYYYTTLSSFLLEITAVDDNIYEYRCNVNVSGNRDASIPVFIITEKTNKETKTYNIYQENLPFIRTFGMVKE